MYLINTHLLYRKDNSGGHSSTVSTDKRFFQEEVSFLNNLLNIINYMRTNSSESGEYSYKNTNAQPVQIKATTEERFQTQR